MKKRHFYIISSIIGLFSIVALKEKDVQNLSIPGFSALVPFTEDEKDLEVSYKVLDAGESKRYLSRDLIDQGYQPIHITVQNNSKETFKMAPSGVSLPLAKPREIAMKITKKAIPRSIAFRVASFFFWPFMIPGAIDSINTYKTHKNLKKSFSAKAIKEEIILPYSTVHRILFVPAEEYQDKFSVVLVNTETGFKEIFQSAT